MMQLRPVSPTTTISLLLASWAWGQSATTQKADVAERPDPTWGRPAPKWFRQAEMFGGWYYACVNAKGYKETFLEGVQKLLDIGFSGLFIDCASDLKECQGPHHHPGTVTTTVFTWSHSPTEAGVT
jgi:hypothetical protein